MALIGQGVNPVAIDYSAIGNDAWRSAASNVSAIGGVIDAVKDRRDKKDAIKTSKELAKAMSVLYPEAAGAMEPIIGLLDDEETPLSQRAALGAQIGELINMGVQKSRDNALLSMERQKIGLGERRVAIAEAIAVSEKDIKLNDAISRFSAIAEMEAPLTGKLPDMTGTQDLISKYIEDGDGQKALNAVESYEKARIKQMEPLMAPEAGLRLTEIPDVDASGQPINRSVFVSPQGDILDINRQPLNQLAPIDGTVLPPRDDVPQEQQRRIPPMPKAGLGIRPAGTALTPTQAKIEEAKLAEIEQNLTKQTDMKRSALAGAEETLKLIDELPTHPGFQEAVGAGFYNAVGGIPGIPDDWTPAGTDKAGAVSKIEKLQAGAFLTAIQQLRGLGALSEAEGKKLEAAAANLNRKQSEEDFKKSLLDYRRQVERVVQEIKSGAGDPAAPAPSTSATDQLRAAKAALGQ